MPSLPAFQCALARAAGVAGAMILAAGLSLPAWALAADGAAAAGSPVLRQFDIPAQPLHEALQTYSLVTGRSLLYDSDAVAGHVSSNVSGRYTAQDALRLMIAGTALTARYTSNEAFVLVPVPAGAHDGVGAAVPVTADAAVLRERYFSYLQTRVVKALCGDPATEPGPYRMALRFRIDAANSIRQLQIHGSGQPTLAQRVRGLLEGLDLVQAPPAQLRQPITMLVMPSSGSGC